MNEDENSGTGLSPGTAALVATWLQWEKSLEPPVATAPSVSTMASYLGGMLTRNEAHGVVRGLTRSQPARRTLIEVQRELIGMKSLSTDEIAALAKGSGLSAEVARAWCAQREHDPRDWETAMERWRNNGWAAIRQQTREGIEGAQAAWAAFLGFGDRLKAEMQTTRLAFARGAEDRIGSSGPIPAPVRLALLDAEVRSDGALYVLVSAQNPDGTPSLSLAGETVKLGLHADGKSWVIAVGSFEDDRAEWTLDGFGGLVGLPAMSLPPDALHLYVGGSH